jgi:hypothetical protein
MRARRKICAAVLALVGPVLLACASPKGPEQRITALVHEQFAQLDATDPEVEYRVGPVRIDPAGGDLYEARFEFDRLASDEAGISHIARREQTWLVRDLSNGTTEILQVAEKKLLAYPGTGPQMVCY